MIRGFNLTIMILVIVIVFFIIDFWLMNQFDQERETRKGWSWDYTMLAIGMSSLVVLQPWLLPYLGWEPHGNLGIIIQSIGILILLASFVLHVWARLHLRQFYVERVELQNEHQIIATGPYAYVRHPIFTTYFGISIGLLLLSLSLVAFVIVIYVFWDFLGATKREEQLLLESLPEYREYMTRTSRFLPKLSKNI